MIMGKYDRLAADFLVTGRDTPGGPHAAHPRRRALHPRGWQCFADIETMLDSLYRQNVQSLLVEGGAQTLQSFIDAGLWDEAWEELSAAMLQSGVPAPRMPYGVELEIVQKFGVPFSHWTNS